MTELNETALRDLAERIVSLAKSKGATLAEAQVRGGWELSARVRLGETELVQEAGHKSAYLRVSRDQRSAVSSTSDLTDGGLNRLASDALELLDLSQPDENFGPADPSLYGTASTDALDLFDPSVSSIDADEAIRLASAAESAALSYDERITLSEGATFARVTGASALVISNGFSGIQRGSYASMSVAPVLLDQDDKRRRGSYWSARRHLKDLETPLAVGEEAARRTLRQVGPRKVETCEAPVVFDPDAARSIIGTFAGCIVGGAIWRKSSYLVDRVGSAVASPLVTLVDDPHLPRGPGSRGYDGDGLLTRKNTVVSDGTLKTYLLDVYSARKLGLESTRSGSSGGAAVAASTSNFFMQPGSESAEALLKRTKRGLYVTSMMGFGFNAITGDFSRGASGFWIEDGKLAYPVTEVTISGNLNDMLLGVDAVADDLDLKSSVASPTFRIASMTIGGS